MKKKSLKRGRPRLTNPMTPAERMRAYRARKRKAGFKRASEWVPTEQHESITYSNHQLLDARSLALHCKIVQKINKDHSLLQIPHQNLKRWRKNSQEQIPGYINEWENILEQPWTNVAAFITNFSEKARRLRQSSPFAGVLSPKERKLIYEAFRA